jgi:hypothetical protein
VFLPSRCLAKIGRYPYRNRHDGRDLQSAPLRWAHIPWHTYQVLSRFVPTFASKRGGDTYTCRQHDDYIKHNFIFLLNKENRLKVSSSDFIEGRKVKHIQSKSCIHSSSHSTVGRVPGHRSRRPGSIRGATRFSEKLWVWNGVHSASWVQLRSCLEEQVMTPV